MFFFLFSFPCLVRHDIRTRHRIYMFNNRLWEEGGSWKEYQKVKHPIILYFCRKSHDRIPKEEVRFHIISITVIVIIILIFFIVLRSALRLIKYIHACFLNLQQPPSKFKHQCCVATVLRCCCWGGKTHRNKYSIAFTLPPTMDDLLPSPLLAPTYWIAPLKNVVL